MTSTGLLTHGEITEARARRAQAISVAGGIEAALAAGTLPAEIDTTLSEVIVLGLLRQEVNTFLCVLGHGSTEIGEVLRIYHKHGVLRAVGVRNEIEASHAATALRWVTGEKAAVLTSIGPGALQALAASIVPASDGLGVWYVFGDETTEDEGPNMQQIPKYQQHSYLQICATVGRAYTLHTPLAVSTALRRGLNTVDHPHRAGPFFLLVPLNTQPSRMDRFNLNELPTGKPPRIGAAADDGNYQKAAAAITNSRKVMVKIGGGSRDAGLELEEFLEVAGAVGVTSPLVSGVIPFDHPRNMTVGGSKGSISGNYAMENADLLVAVGSRFVCQSDCSRTGYPNVRKVINVNTDFEAAAHYQETIPLLGDAAPTLQRLIKSIKDYERNHRSTIGSIIDSKSDWIRDCFRKRQEWDEFRTSRYKKPALYDDVWGQEILTQPAAIKAATDWARSNNVVCFFDAGDPQANGFQVVEDDRLGRTVTETGASYMGFAVSALLATGLSKRIPYGLAISGDGSFTMNPQVLIDGVEHGACGCVLLLDNRRMAAISGLQNAQYGSDHATSDNVAVDYLSWARSVAGVMAFDGGRSMESLSAALDLAIGHDGLSLIHVPVYHGMDELGGMGVFGRWNVGNWVENTQNMRHRIGL